MNQRQITYLEFSKWLDDPVTRNYFLAIALERDEIVSEMLEGYSIEEPCFEKICAQNLGKLQSNESLGQPESLLIKHELIEVNNEKS